MASLPTLHLVIPGLLTPLATWKRDYDFVPASSLLVQKLSGMKKQKSGQADWISTVYALLPPSSETTTVSHAENCFAFEFGQAPPVTDVPGAVLCADPIELEAGMSDIMIGTTVIDDLTPREQQQLQSLLNQHFSQDGWYFRVSGQGRWFLLLPQQHKPEQTFSIELALGKSLRDLVEGTEAVQWSKQLNELQMLLYSSVTNQQREQQRQRQISSFWLWDIVTPAYAPCSTAGDLKFIAGGGYEGQVMAHHAQVDWMDFFDEAPDKDLTGIYIYRDLVIAARENNLAMWQEKLQQLEAFLPVLFKHSHRRVVLHTGDGVFWQQGQSLWGRLTGGRWRLKKTLLDYL